MNKVEVGQRWKSRESGRIFKVERLDDERATAFSEPKTCANGVWVDTGCAFGIAVSRLVKKTRKGGFELMGER